MNQIRTNQRQIAEEPDGESRRIEEETDLLRRRRREGLEDRRRLLKEKPPKFCLYRLTR